MKQDQFTSFVRAFAMFLVLASRPAAFADVAKGEDVPPVENASFHQLVFADEDLDVLNNFYPPSGDSGFHSHVRAMFYVVIQPSEFSGQNLGMPLAAGPKVVAGAAAFNAISEKPIVHRIVNGNKGTFQIIVVELRRPKPLGQEVSSRKAASQYTQIIDNARLRAWRLILEPGQSTPSITQGGKGIRVVVRGGLLTTVTPGVPPQVLVLRPGDFAVQRPGLTRALTNSGADTIELVEVELK